MEADIRFRAADIRQRPDRRNKRKGCLRGKAQAPHPYCSKLERDAGFQQHAGLIALVEVCAEHCANRGVVK